MILGLRTVCYPAPDLEKMKSWYTELLGQKPYFDEPFYVGFNVGGFELGLVPDLPPGAVGSLVYWGVADVEAEVARLRALGAPVHEEPKDVGGGIKVAAVKDPAGNVLGLIQNPHFDLSAVR